MPDERKYRFHWGLLGDIELGRPNLGNTTRIENYRLMQFTLRDVLERHFGADQADRLFYEAGFLAGQEFYQRLPAKKDNLDGFLGKLSDALQEMSIGILRVEKSDPAAGQFIVTVSEDLDCSGLPELGDEICNYDEGFLAGILESHTGQPFYVKEIDCWCTGDRTCRFRAELRRGQDG